MPEALTASKQLLPRQALDQPNPLGRTGPVASHHLQAQRTAQGIAKCMDVGGRPTAKEAGRWKFLFLLPGARLVCLARGRFQHQRLVAGLLQSEKKCFAMPPLVPAGRALVHRTHGHGPWAKGQRQVMPGPAGIGDPECADNGSAGQPARGSAQPGVTPRTRKLLSVLRVFLGVLRTHLGVFQPSSPGRACAGSY